MIIWKEYILKCSSSKTTRSILLSVLTVVSILAILTVLDGPPTLTNRALADEIEEEPYYYYASYVYLPILIRSFFQ